MDEAGIVAPDPVRHAYIYMRDKRTGVEEWIPLEKAAELMGLPAAEIEWALEEFGEVERGNWIALEPDW